MADESSEKGVRAQWQGQLRKRGDMTSDEVRTKVHDIEKHARRRARGMYLAAAVIIASWAAVMWSLPDLRATAVIAMAAACWIVGQTHKRTAARIIGPDLAPAPGVDFYCASLERERDFNSRLPVWFVPPAVLSSTAIVLGFLTTPRFPHTLALYGVLAWILCGTAVALTVGIQKSRRETKRCQQLIDEVRCSELPLVSGPATE